MDLCLSPVCWLGIVLVCVVGRLFNRKSAFIIASGHLFLGRCDCFNMALP